LVLSTNDTASFALVVIGFFFLNLWCFCTVPNYPGGWVPEQLIERRNKPGHGIAKEDYTAKELDVNGGDELLAIKFLNGWVWCQRLSDQDIGWVPKSTLKNIK